MDLHRRKYRHGLPDPARDGFFAGSCEGLFSHLAIGPEVVIQQVCTSTHRSNTDNNVAPKKPRSSSSSKMSLRSSKISYSGCRKKSSSASRSRSDSSSLRLWYKGPSVTAMLLQSMIHLPLVVVGGSQYYARNESEGKKRSMKSDHVDYGEDILKKLNCRDIKVVGTALQK